MTQIENKHGRLPHTLILPVETLNREFDAKLHLGLKAAARGWKVIIGGRRAIHGKLHQLPRSVYLAKGIRTGNRRILKIVDDLGHIIVALDEEALIRQSDEALLMMLDEETFNRPRLLYAWGRSNADVWRRFRGYHGTPILEVGNPRVDMLRPELAGFYADDVASLKKRFGKFILFSSNFSLVNHFISGHVRFKTAKGSNAKRSGEIKSGLVAHKGQIFDAFRAMIPELAAAIAPANLIIRPHPSENRGTWLAIASGLSNVHVVHEGPITPWLMAARGLVQNGCTSAVEAAIVGTRAFSFKPVESTQYDVELPDGVSRKCFTIGELMDEVRSCLKGRDGQPAYLSSEQKKLLLHHIASAEGPLSAERILDSLTGEQAVLERQSPAPLRKLAGLMNHFAWRVERTVTNRMKGSPSGMKYATHKFPGITHDKIMQNIDLFRKVIPGLPQLNLRQFATNIYCLERAGETDAR